MPAALGSSTVPALNAGEGIGLEALPSPSQHPPQFKTQGEHTEQPQPLRETAARSIAAKRPAWPANFSAAADSELNSAKPSHPESPNQASDSRGEGKEGRRARQRCRARERGGCELSGGRACGVDNFSAAPLVGEGGGSRGRGNRQRDWVGRALSHTTRSLGPGSRQSTPGAWPTKFATLK
jgi:hypothetical protein